MPEDVLEVLFEIGCHSAGAVPVEAEPEPQAPADDDWPVDPFWIEAGWIDLKGGD